MMPKNFQKHDAAKLRYELTPVAIEEAIADIFTYGAEKYDAWNWLQDDAEWSRIYGALRRHLAAHWSGEFLDQESGRPHLAHVLVNTGFLLIHAQNGSGIDDRPGARAEKIMQKIREEQERPHPANGKA